MSVLIFKGSPHDGQAGVLSAFFDNYIEETASYIRGATSLELAEVNSLSQNLNSPSQRIGNLFATIQGNSLISYSSIDTDDETDEDITTKTTKISIYTVQESDTLSFIADDYGVSVNTIVWANNIRNINSISPGTELKIPPVSGIVHTVRSGETISSIASKYGVEQDSILSYNLLPKGVDSIQVGQEIIVPGGSISVSSSTKAVTTSVTRFAYLPDLGGYFAQPTTGYNWGYIHGRNGIDIANSCGTNVYAAASGNVNFAATSGWNGGYGNFLRITHPNGTETLYAHLSKLLVSQSNWVEKGQLIALMGTTGRSTGCHLHFEVHGARNPMAKY
ncbi:MAG: hypothetical protein COV29_02785 [Candidatus Yanofskybacteria bacterium CG10_big_fil_rev_8_21_14_0_10_36_16]|uniref:LysM domain-containing protein n=1 Tax=Candidatus Yanofskybacteria bacterium CG10_big_fil_rev_8_21_14_0_10_36_16 TaxID=1975096 RepID=A0A2J0Q892_9BACT|nr:MAG: hypothetical protein COV29_02785 [Candidatus Yanofskybacteria bacterium CG10_big_fil_rev_8_21_14_0_10_36_16]